MEDYMESKWKDSYFTSYLAVYLDLCVSEFVALFFFFLAKEFFLNLSAHLLLMLAVGHWNKSFVNINIRVMCLMILFSI